MFRDRSLSREFVQRARDSGYVALQLTVDVTVSGNRERDIVTGMTVPPKLALMSLFDIAMKPKWVYKHLTTPKIEVANIAHRPPPGSEKLGGIIQFLNAQIDRSVTWKDAEWMIKEWGGPFAIKGIMTGADAKRAADIGATAVMVSNHGGRQLDFSPAPFDVLEGDRRRRRRPPRGDSRRRRAPRHAHLEGARARGPRLLRGPAASLWPRRRRRSRRRPGAEDLEDRARARHGAARLRERARHRCELRSSSGRRRGRRETTRGSAAIDAAARRCAASAAASSGQADDPDLVATEEPFEIRLGYSRRDGSRAEEPVSVTMRTPGHDEDLAVGLPVHRRHHPRAQRRARCRGARAARGRRA